MLPFDPGQGAVIACGADPDTRIVSFTVTEAGYFLGPDGRPDSASQALQDSLADVRAGRPGATIYSVLAAILRARREGADLTYRF